MLTEKFENALETPGKTHGIYFLKNVAPLISVVTETNAILSHIYKKCVCPFVTSSRTFMILFSLHMEQHV